MVTPEGKVKKKVKKILDSVGAYYVMPVSGGYGRHGIPDFLVCWQGKFIAIETKAGKGVPTALQYREMEKIVKAGGSALVINEDNITDLEGVFNATT
jgi:hypothetical protein